jgi:hypothetical protein
MRTQGRCDAEVAGSHSLSAEDTNCGPANEARDGFGYCSLAAA